MKSLIASIGISIVAIVIALTFVVATGFGCGVANAQALPAAQEAPSGVWQSANPAALLMIFAPNAWEPTKTVDVFEFPEIPNTLEVSTAHGVTKVWAQANSNACSGGAGFGCTYEGKFSKLRQSVTRIMDQDVLRVSGNLIGTFRDMNGVTHEGVSARMYFETIPGPMQSVMATGPIVLEIEQ